MTDGSTTIKITTLDIVIKTAELGVANDPSTRLSVNRLSVVAAMVVAPERWLQYLTSLDRKKFDIAIHFHQSGLSQSRKLR
jgi:hypothetical protein